MANSNKSHVINFDNLVNYVDPADIYMTDNGVHTMPAPEDYTIYVDLEMEVPRRSNTLITSEAAGRFILKWEIGDTSERTINSGSDFYKSKTKNATIQYLSTDGTEYIYQDIKDGKKTGEMFGMESISVDYNAYFVPEITIKFTDIRGTSLLSPAQQRAEAQGYAVKANSHLDADSLNRITNDIEGSFFQGLFAFPYPKMTLKIKGMYGDPIAYELTVAKVDSNFESASGNYSVTVRMIGYAFSLLNDISMAALVAAPSDLLVGKDHWDNVIQKDDRYLLSDGTKMPLLSDLLTRLARLAKEQDLLDQTEEKLKEENKTQIERTQAVLDALDEFTKGLSGTTTGGKTVGYKYRGNANFVVLSDEALDGSDTTDNFYTKVLNNTNNGKLLKKLNEAIGTYYEAGTDIEGLPRAGFTSAYGLIGVSRGNLITQYHKAITRSADASGYTCENSEFKQMLATHGEGTTLNYTSTIPGSYNAYVVDPEPLKARVKTVLQNLKNNETTITNQIQSEQITKYRDVLGFTPSLYNVMAIVMAHFECLLMGFKHVEDTVKQEVGEQKRNPESLNIYGSYYDVTADKQMFPFPQVTCVQTTGDLTRKSTTSWLGHYAGAVNEPEVQWIEGLIRGILNYESESTEAENIVKSESSDTAGLVTSSFAAYTDLFNISYRNDKDKSPWGNNVDFTSPANLAARIAIRAQQVMMRQKEAGFNDNINPGYLGIVDAYNFFKMYENEMTTPAKTTLADKDTLISTITGATNDIWGGGTFLSDTLTNKYGKCRIGNNNSGSTVSTDMAAVPLHGYDVSGYYNETPGVWSTSGGTYYCKNFKILKEQGWFYSESDKYAYDGVMSTDNKLKLFKTSELKGYLGNPDETMKACGFKVDDDKYKAWKETYLTPGETKADLDEVFDVDPDDNIQEGTNTWNRLFLPFTATHKSANPFFVFEYYDDTNTYSRAFSFLNSMGVDLSQFENRSGFKAGTLLQFVLMGAWLWAEDNRGELKGLSGVLYDSKHDIVGSVNKAGFSNKSVERLFYKQLFTGWVDESFDKVEKALALTDRNTGGLVSGTSLRSLAVNSDITAEDLFNTVVSQANTEAAYGKFSLYHSVVKEGDTYLNTYYYDETTGKRTMLGEEGSYTEWYGLKKKTAMISLGDGKKAKITYFDDELSKENAIDPDIRITPEVSKSLGLYEFATESYTLLNMSRIDKSAMASMNKSYFTQYITHFAKAFAYLTKDKKYDDPVSYNTAGEKTINASKVDEAFKIDLYSYLKKVYDKWLAGNNYVLTQKSRQQKLSKSWYDDYSYENFFKKHFYFIDDLYNDVGSYILINFTTLLKELLAVMDINVSLLQFITNLEAKHGVQFLSIQNFSDLGDKDCLERAFKQVPIYDMRTVSPTPDFISIYSYKPSQAINIPGSDYDDDSVSMQTELMVKETVKPNKIAVGEKVHQLPCFGVPYASQYQHFFSDIGINTSESMATMDSINATFSLANLWQEGNSDRKVYSMGQDLYTVYNNRSYTCTLTMLGSAWVQPLMYFELLNAPMFKGAYQIKKVTHEISQGRMTTKIVGVRICRYIDNFLLNANALSLYDRETPAQELAEGKKANVGNDCAYTKYDIVTDKKNNDLNKSRNITALSSYNPGWLNQGLTGTITYANLWEAVLSTIKSIVTDANNAYLTPGHNVNIQLVASLFYVQAAKEGWEAFLMSNTAITPHRGRKKIGTTDPDDALIKQLVEEVFLNSPDEVFKSKVTVSAGSYMKIVEPRTIDPYDICTFKAVYLSNNTANDTAEGNIGYAAGVTDTSIKASTQSDCFVFYDTVNEGCNGDLTSKDDNAGSEELNVSPDNSISEPSNLTDREVLFVRALKKTLANVEAFSGDLRVEKDGDYIFISPLIEGKNLVYIVFDAIVSTYAADTNSVFIGEHMGFSKEGEKLTYNAVRVKVSNGSDLSKSVGLLMRTGDGNQYTTPRFSSTMTFADSFKKTIVKSYFGQKVTRETIATAKKRASELPNYTPSSGAEWNEDDITAIINHFSGITIENCPPTETNKCNLYREPAVFIAEAKARFESEQKDTTPFTAKVGNKSLANVFNSDTARVNKVSNEPVKDEYYTNAYDTLKQLAKVLSITPVTSGGTTGDTAHFSITNATITSGYRSNCVNEKVNGSSSNSMHMRGWAIDFQYNAGTGSKKGDAEYVFRRILAYAKAYYKANKVALFDQLLCESNGNSHWVHFGNYSVGANGAPRRRGEYFFKDVKTGAISEFGKLT